MFDIDKYLDDIHIKEVDPSEELLQRTLKRCEETEENKRKRAALIKRIQKAALIALPAAAVLVFALIIGFKLFSQKADAIAYYTVDINPSICINVDKDNIVTGVTGQNEDAEALLGGLNCVGQPVGEAIKLIVAAARDAGYFSEGQRPVLIGCFGEDTQSARSALGDLQAQLEAEFGGMFELLIISGSLKDKQAADALGVSAGLFILKQMAGEAELQCEDNVEDILDEVTEVNQDKFCAPVLTVGSDAKNLKFSWSALDFNEMGYVGKVKYHIVAAETSAGIKEFSARRLKTVYFCTFNTQPASLSIALADCGVGPGESKYFGIWAEYGGVIIAGNAVYYKVPEAAPTATPEPSESEPASPRPSESDAPATGHTVKGKISGSNIILSWGKETASNFAGYKVVASKTNSSPKYPDDGYLKYITDADTTSIKLYEGYEGLKGDTYYYFSITYLFEDGSAIAGNAVRLKMPAGGGTDEPDESEAPSGDYVSTNISGYISDSGKVCLSWGRIKRSAYPKFEGYKVVYSFTPEKPIYGVNTYDYIEWITNDATTSCCFSPSDIGAKAGQKVYFSITALYDNHSVKKAGNMISLTMPGNSEPDEPYVSTTVGGSISDDGTISLHWGKVNHSEFDYYKVVYSFSDKTPAYEDDHSILIRYFDCAGTTSCSIDACDISGFDPGDTVYFSVTVLYKDGTKKAGNGKSFTWPVEPDPTPTATPPSESPSDPPPSESPSDPPPSESPSEECSEGA